MLKLKHYVCGFMFNADYSNVALVRKSKPNWQRGRLNGIGGKIEKGETADVAMAREFFEETVGYQTSQTDWHPFCRLSCCNTAERSYDYVHFYATTGDLTKIDTERLANLPEPIVIYPVNKVYLLDRLVPAIENLGWLILLAADHLTDKRPEYVLVNYPNSEVASADHPAPAPIQTDLGAITNQLLALTNSSPVLTSLLYDIDLLPEQLERGSKEWNTMLKIAAWHANRL